MKVAVMQPYLFPYIGYFQLIRAVDTFVVFDDVNYIKKGWINRNNILVNGDAHLFTIPLKKASQNKLINETCLNNETDWKTDFLRIISAAYKKAPFFQEAFPLIEAIINSDEENLGAFIAFSLKEICRFLSIGTNIIISSGIEKDSSLKGPDKIIAICKELGATDYVNAIGGKLLYSAAMFSESRISLRFIESQRVAYPQFKNEFIPWLSIIDVMMFNSQEQVIQMLGNYRLVS